MYYSMYECDANMFEQDNFIEKSSSFIGTLPSLLIVFGFLSPFFDKPKDII